MTIRLMESFFTEQFRINDNEKAFAYWEVYDRTVDEKEAVYTYTNIPKECITKVDVKL